VRFINTLLASGTAWLLFLTANCWFKASKTGLWTVLLMATAPLYNMGSMLATYDGPQVFFWAVGLYLVTQTVQQDRPPLWYAVGAVVGIGILCKLTMIVFAPGVLLLLLLSPEYRKHLSTPHPYLAFGVTILCTSPLLFWNATHGNANYLHAWTLGSRNRGAGFGRWFGEFLGGQLGVVGPWLFVAELVAIWGLVRAAKNKKESTNAKRFLLAFAFPMLALCFWTALRSKMEANWPAPLHLAGLMAVAVGFATAWERKKRLGILVCVLLSLFIQSIILFPEWIGRTFSPLDGKTIGIKLCEPYNWDDMATLTQAARKQLEAEGKPVLLLGTNYRVNSIVAFHLPDHPKTQALYLGSRLDQYHFWTDIEGMKGKNAVLYFDHKASDDEKTLKEVQKYFASVTLYGAKSTHRPGFNGPVKEWTVYLCRDFKGYTPQPTGY
jgi:4-amino-4-deoxy-L-arabinose transferase-like glycosyltransferase